MEVQNMYNMQSGVAMAKNSSLFMLANVAANVAAPDFTTTPMPIIDKENDMNAGNIDKLAVHVGKMKYLLRFGADLTNEKDEKKTSAEISPQKKKKDGDHGRVIHKRRQAPRLLKGKLDCPSFKATFCCVAVCGFVWL